MVSDLSLERKSPSLLALQARTLVVTPIFIMQHMLARGNGSPSKLTASLSNILNRCCFP